MKIAILLCLCLTLRVFAINECVKLPHQATRVSFYVCAHQDDWQLFMGTDAYNDINDTTPERPKVVIVYTTAGNLNDIDDTKTCNCGDVNDPKAKRMAYWEVREIGAKNAVHLAANRPGEYGPPHYPKSQKVEINGHLITRYEFRNTVSYFLRIKGGNFGCWYNNYDCSLGTVDNADAYKDRADFEHTLGAIFRIEKGVLDDVTFHTADTNEQINQNDQHDHIITGTATIQAAGILARQSASVFPISLYINYHTKNLPANITGAAAQNEAALTATYCLALLNYNAWPEWGSDYQTWTCRNYYRTLQIGAN